MPHVNGNLSAMFHTGSAGLEQLLARRSGWRLNGGVGAPASEVDIQVQLHTCHVLEPLAALGDFLARSVLLPLETEGGM